MRTMRVSTLIAAAAGLLLLAGPASAQPNFDFGDAPDGVSTEYVTGAQPPPAGAFPSLLASDGPRHVGIGARLGVGADREPDSRQVDRDRFDDGASFDRLAPCSRSRLTVLVNVRNLPARALRQAARRNESLFINAWADWNRDGDWDDVLDCPEGTADEWFAHNVAVPLRRVLGGARPRAWKPRNRWILPVQIAFRGGPQVKEFWWRATLTLGERVTQRGGVSPTPYKFGETEDYRHLSEPIPPPEDDGDGDGNGRGNSPFGVGCGYSPLFHDSDKNPPPIVMPHGQARRVLFSLFNFRPDLGTPAPRWRLLRVNKQKFDRPVNRFRDDFIRGMMLRLPGRFDHIVRGFTLRSVKKHTHGPKTPIERHRIVFGFRRPTGDPPPRFFNERTVCSFIIVHVNPFQRGAGGPAPPPGVPVFGEGFFEPDGADPRIVHFGLRFDQDVDGFVIYPAGGSPPIVGFDIPGFDCEVQPDGSVRCTGSVRANEPVFGFVEVDGLVERLEATAIKDGRESQPFELEPGFGAGTIR